MGRSAKRFMSKRNQNVDDKDSKGKYLYDLSLTVGREGLKNKTKLGKKFLKKWVKAQEKKGKVELRPNLHGEGGFHKVTVFVSDKVEMDKEFLMSSLNNFIDMSFTPLGYFREKETITFYFDSDLEIAQAIHKLHSRIQNPSGSLMPIKVEFIPVTDFVLNCNQVKILKEVMMQRLTDDPISLELSSLRYDPQLLENNIFVDTSNQQILKQVFTIIRDDMPEITILDLSDNKLKDVHLKLFEILTLKCRLSAVNFENNRLSDTKSLGYLKRFPLKEIKLENNKYPGISAPPSPNFISAVRRCLPLIKMINGSNITLTTAMRRQALAAVAPASCQSSRRSTAPSSPKRGTSATSNSYALLSEDFGKAPSSPEKPNEKLELTESGIKTYLEQYYALIDTEQKVELLQAYVPYAVIELKSSMKEIESRNFKDLEGVAEFLHAWPATEHDHGSFELQVGSLTGQEAVVQVAGTYRVVESDVTLPFKRTMTILAYNNGMCCSHDILEI